MTAHRFTYITCDWLGGKPEHRTVCREKGVILRGDDVLPTGWRTVLDGHGHLCPEHAHRTDGTLTTDVKQASAQAAPTSGADS